MKWLEKKYGQSQTEFFALRGLPWHLTHVVRLQPSQKSTEVSEKVFQNRTFCHSFDNCIQNGSTVVSILQDIFIRLKRDHPEIEVAFLRSDNAGCYHGAETILSVKELYETTGILIRRIDFSEAQAGKGPCDRKAAVIKGEIRRYVDEKHNCTTSTEFVEAAKSTHHLTILSCSLPVSNEKTKIKWDGIEKYSNIEFIPKPILTTKSSSLSTTAPSSTIRARISSLSSSSTTSRSATPRPPSSTTSTKMPLEHLPIELEIKAWRAFGIGSGRVFEWADLTAVNTITPLIVDPNAQHLNNGWKSETPLKG